MIWNWRSPKEDRANRCLSGAASSYRAVKEYLDNPDPKRVVSVLEKPLAGHGGAGADLLQEVEESIRRRVPTAKSISSATPTNPSLGRSRIETCC